MGTYGTSDVVQEPVEGDTSDIDVERVLRYSEGLQTDVQDVLCAVESVGKAARELTYLWTGSTLSALSYECYLGNYIQLRQLDSETERTQKKTHKAADSSSRTLFVETIRLIIGWLQNSAIFPWLPHRVLPTWFVTVVGRSAESRMSVRGHARFGVISVCQPARTYTPDCPLLTLIPPDSSDANASSCATRDAKVECRGRRSDGQRGSIEIADAAMITESVGGEEPGVASGEGEPGGAPYWRSSSTISIRSALRIFE